MGSAFWHGSHTTVGNRFDNNMISVIAYVAHQMTTINLLGNSSVLKELSPEPRLKSSVEVSEDLILMFTEKPVAEWAGILDTCDIPHNYFITFAAIITTIVSLLLPWSLTNYAMETILPKVLKDDVSSFMLDQYLPELNEGT